MEQAKTQEISCWQTSRWTMTSTVAAVAPRTARARCCLYRTGPVIGQLPPHVRADHRRPGLRVVCDLARGAVVQERLDAAGFGPEPVLEHRGAGRRGRERLSARCSASVAAAARRARRHRLEVAAGRQQMPATPGAQRPAAHPRAPGPRWPRRFGLSSLRPSVLSCGMIETPLIPGALGRRFSPSIRATAERRTSAPT